MRFASLVLLVACHREVDPSEAAIEAYDPLPLVNPFVGTGGLAAQVAGVNPGAKYPLGLVHVGPNSRHSSTGDLGFYHFAGYHYDDDRIEGFAHTHAHGMGVNDYGAVHVMPRAAWDDRYTNDRLRAAPFTHDREEASPGRYAVDLQDDGTHVEIVATQRGALHTWTFEPNHEPIVLFDLGHGLGNVVIEQATFAFDPDTRTVDGFELVNGSYSGRFGGAKTWFTARFDPAPVTSGVWDADGVHPGESTYDGVGTGSGAWLVFPEGTTTVKMALAVSYVDPDGARANLDAEHPDFDAAARLADTEAAWRAELGRVRVRGGTDAERVTFHTALYHALFMPTRFTDIDGRYRGLDGEVHTAEFDYLTDLSLWDTFRTLHSLWNLAWPDHQRSVLTSLVQMVEDGGSLPRWPLAHGYTSGMVGTPAQQLFAESAQKGLTGWDEDAAFEVASFVSFNGQPHASRDGLASYLDLGYVSKQASGTSASLTLEYVWSDHAMQQWALHRSDDVAAASFAELADNWKNQWNPDAGFFLGRNADGSFPEFEPGDEEGWTSDFVEGNAWHYRYGVPFDVAGQIELQAGGDRAAWLADYATYWDNVRDEPDDALPDTYYWHGNEPVMHYAFLGSLADAPDLTADAARWVLANRYGPEADGLDGNDDSGTLSSWYALAAMGAFPIAGTDVYALSSPLFERVEIDTDWGELVIRAPGTSDVARYVAAARLGEAPLTSASFSHDEWVTAGELVFEMSATPGAWPDGVDD